MMKLVSVSTLCLAAIGCSVRSGQQETVPQAFDPLCGAPRRAIVAETDGRSPLVRLATDTMADGLAQMGFQVLAPRHAMPAANARTVNDWIFSPEIATKPDGRLEINVELYSLVDQRRVWAITDAVADLRRTNEPDTVVQGIQTALQMLESDLLRCRSDEPQ